MTRKILLTEFRQESNSLSPVRSDLGFWRRSGWVLPADEVHDAHRGEQSALGGMIRTLAASGDDVEVVYGPAMYAQSGGTAEQEVMEHYLDQLLPSLEAHGPLDGVFFSFHGALQTSGFDDAEAEVVRRVRQLVGDECVLAASTDLHGYVSKALAAGLDVLCGYHTYPHVDFVETGERAAVLGLAAIQTGARPAMAWAPVPMMVSASTYNTLSGPFAELFDFGDDLVRAGRILDYSIYQMQPWLDVAEPNSAVVAIAHDEASARAAADDLAERLYGARHHFTADLHSLDDVVNLSQDADVAKPVIVVDSADSNNAGAPGDSMAVARRILERRSTARSATVVADRAAAHRAHELGVGAAAEFTIGGAIDTRAPKITATGYVRSLHDGEFRPQGVGSAGSLVRLGRTAVLRFGALDVVVCETIAGNGDPQLYRAFGIEPTMYDLVVVKANTSFRVGYRSIGGTICETDTPGCASPVVADLPFRKLPRTIYPWVDAETVSRSEVLRRPWSPSN
ncbi:MAG TPA: M81 family metallopeptidase [Nocardioides sp.]|nr:M81 family metallopeptidase [Nocardioides sp.]